MIFDGKDQSIVFKIHRLAYGLARIADAALENAGGLTFAQMRILIAMKRMPECSQSTIAKFRHLTEAAVSRQIEILVEKKLVTRVDNSQNRREHVLELTDLGGEELGKATKIVEEKFEKVFGILSEEESVKMAEILDKLTEVVYAKNNA